MLFQWPILICAAAVIAFQACKSLDETVFWASKETSEILHYFSSSERYFSDDIVDFFPSSVEFERDFNRPSQAGDGIRIIEVKRLSNESGSFHEENLSWSDDGHLLGYEVASGGHRSIKVIDLKKGYDKVLGRNNLLEPIRSGLNYRSSQEFNAYLRWSHDSKSFSFMSNAKAGSYNIHLGGLFADEKVIAENPQKDGFATWSPTTTEIVFSSARSGAANLYLYKNGSKPRPITNSSSTDIYPEWMKHGRGILFVSEQGIHQQIMLVKKLNNSSNWTKPRRLTKSKSSELRPIVSPDGKFVAFYRQGFDQTWSIHVLPLFGNKIFSEKELSKTMIAKDVYLDLNTGVAWSPDSRKIFYIGNDSVRLNPIFGYDLYQGKRFMLDTETTMNRDLIMSKLGVLSFCAQTGSWDRVYLALTNQGLDIQLKAKVLEKSTMSSIKYIEKGA